MPSSATAHAAFKARADVKPPLGTCEAGDGVQLAAALHKHTITASHPHDVVIRLDVALEGRGTPCPGDGRVSSPSACAEGSPSVKQRPPCGQAWCGARKHHTLAWSPFTPLAQCVTTGMAHLLQRRMNPVRACWDVGGGGGLLCHSLEWATAACGQIMLGCRCGFTQRTRPSPALKAVTQKDGQETLRTILSLRSSSHLGFKPAQAAGTADHGLCWLQAHPTSPGQGLPLSFAGPQPRPHL